MTISPRDPLVVIVTPVYDGADFLAETMECVQAQTYQNLVHCVFDNASTDATSEIIAHFAGRRVPLITARNTTTIPVIENWNAALTLVPPATDYFRILSADDKIVPSYIAKMVALGAQNPEIGVFACHERLNTSLIGADLPTDRIVFDGRAIVRRSLLQKLRFPYDHCLYRHPPTGIPKSFFDTDYCGTRLLCADTDAAMRLVSRTGCAVVHEPLGTTRWPGAVTAAEMLPNKTGIWSILQLIDRWGPSVFDTKAEYSILPRPASAELLSAPSALAGTRQCQIGQVAPRLAAPSVGFAKGVRLCAFTSRMAVHPDHGMVPQRRTLRSVPLERCGLDLRHD